MKIPFLLLGLILYSALFASEDPIKIETRRKISEDGNVLIIYEPIYQELKDKDDFFQAPSEWKSMQLQDLATLKTTQDIVKRTKFIIDQIERYRNTWKRIRYLNKRNPAEVNVNQYYGAKIANFSQHSLACVSYNKINEWVSSVQMAERMCLAHLKTEKVKDTNPL